MDMYKKIMSEFNKKNKNESCEGKKLVIQGKYKNLICLSSQNLEGKVLKPRVPENFLTKNGYEDNTTKRVCFASSIDKCLMAMSQNLKDKEFFVHIPIDNQTLKIKKPNINQVPDSKITGETWVLNDVKLQCVGKIKVLRDKGEDGLVYTYGDNKKAELYEWTYKVLNEGNLEQELMSEEEFERSVEEREKIAFNESKLTKEERDNLPESVFGLPEERRYPMPDKEHVILAIRYFNKVEPEKEKELASNIIRRIKELDIKNINVSESNRFYKYYKEYMNINESDETSFNQYILEAKKLNKLFFGLLSTSEYSRKLNLEEDFHNNLTSILKCEEDFNNGKLSEYTIFYYGMPDVKVLYNNNQTSDLDISELNTRKKFFNHSRMIARNAFKKDFYNTLSDFTDYNSIKELLIDNNAGINIQSKTFKKKLDLNENTSYNDFDNVEKILTEAVNTKTKRERVEELIYKVISVLDVTGINTKKYKDFFSKMSNEQFDKYMKKFLKDEDENFYLEILPNKNEPTMDQIQKSLDILKIPMEEYVYLRHDGHHDDPIRTRTPVPVG